MKKTISHQERSACKPTPTPQPLAQISICSTKEREPDASKAACNTGKVTMWPSRVRSEVDFRVTTVMVTCPCTHSPGTTHPVSSHAMLVSFFIRVAQRFLDAARDTLNTSSASSTGHTMVLTKVASIHMSCHAQYMHCMDFKYRFPGTISPIK